MIKSKLTKVKKSGYAKDRIKKPLKKEPAPAAPVPPRPTKPLLPGLQDALITMSHLNRDLQELKNGDYIASVEPGEDQWMLVVRGPRPPMNYYYGYEVRWIKSNYVKNPKAMLTR